jgi:hypothetical protein
LEENFYSTINMIYVSEEREKLPPIRTNSKTYKVLSLFSLMSLLKILNSKLSSVGCCGSGGKNGEFIDENKSRRKYANLH